jgi:hypothetical protein
MLLNLSLRRIRHFFTTFFQFFERPFQLLCSFRDVNGTQGPPQFYPTQPKSSNRCSVPPSVPGCARDDEEVVRRIGVCCVAYGSVVLCCAWLACAASAAVPAVVCSGYCRKYRGNFLVGTATMRTAAACCESKSALRRHQQSNFTLPPQTCVVEAFKADSLLQLSPQRARRRPQAPTWKTLKFALTCANASSLL